jgi:acetylornithine/succinyldiaminopimelate/putrescine aminotransferase
MSKRNRKHYRNVASQGDAMPQTPEGSTDDPSMIEERMSEELRNEEPLSSFSSSTYEDSDPENLEDSDKAAEIETPRRKEFTGSPRGIRRADDHGLELLDAMAGRSSVFGFGHKAIVDVFSSIGQTYLGDGSAYEPMVADDVELLDAFLTLSGTDCGCDVQKAFCMPSPGEAIDWIIAAIRRPTQFRTITLAGSDHGRTGVGRTAGGLVSLQQNYGPLMAGFVHVRGSDPRSLAAAVDDQTAAILLSVQDTNHGNKLLGDDFLIAARELCNERKILLVIDQTQTTLGDGGKALAHQCIADVDADAVILSAGLFGGISGAMVLVGDAVECAKVPHFPLQSALASATLRSMHSSQTLSTGFQRSSKYAVELAEVVSEFEFVRDLNRFGMSMGIETDVESEAIVAQAARDGLRIESAGDNAFRFQLPLALSDSEWGDFLDRFKHILSAIRSRFAVST